MNRIGAERMRQQVLAGGYRLHDWRSAGNVHREYLVHLVTTGAMVPETLEAAKLLEVEGIPSNVINLTSPRRLYESWKNTPKDNDPFNWLIPRNERHAPIVVVNDAASHAHAWIGGVFGMPVLSLGVDTFGQSGNRADLYKVMGIDPENIVNTALRGLNQVGLA